MDDIIIRLIPLPGGIEGFVLDSPDGYHNIYINANLSRQRQQEVYRHERIHIRDGHLYSAIPVAICERIASQWM